MTEVMEAGNEHSLPPCCTRYLAFMLKQSR